MTGRTPVSNDKLHIDVIDALRAERDALLELLGGLRADQWARPTECPKWTVHGIALHLLGDDLSLLSRQRDAEPSGLIQVAQCNPGLSFLEFLHRFNERWVDAGPFISAQVLVELLRFSGKLTADFYSNVDRDTLGEPVFWLGPQPAPYWLIASREFGERWVHHHQVARAVGVSGPRDNTLRRTAAESLMPVFAARFVALDLSDNTRIVIDANEIGRWTIARSDGSWTAQLDDANKPPTAELSIPDDAFAPMFSKGLTSTEILSAIAVHGDNTTGNAQPEPLRTSSAA